MVFTLEEDSLQKASPAAANTRKLYRSKLNSISKAKLADNRSDLKSNNENVIAYIKMLYPGDTEADRHKKRFIVYSIFWALDKDYISSTNPYYEYLQSILPKKHSVSGVDWVPLAQYRAALV